MRRRAGLLLAVLALLSGGFADLARADQAGVLHRAPGVPPQGAAAAGALVWIHPYYTEGGPPPAPEWVGRMARMGWDIWRYDWLEALVRRAPSGPRNPNALTGGVAELAQGTAALRGLGYRRVVLLGESRGAFIALAALQQPGLADAVLLASPAAHGTRPERRPQALADFRAALDRARPDAARRLALMLFEGDDYDPDPDARAAAFRAAVARLGVGGLLIDRPAAPVGHGGVQDEAFDAIFGACLVRFLDFTRPVEDGCR